MDAPRLTTLLPGRPWPLGASCDAGPGGGVHFAVASAHATRIELCLFDASGTRELTRTPLPGHDGDVFHGRLPGAGPGLVYGYRAHGPWRPDRGHRFAPAKLLLDPYAREVVGRFVWRDEQFGHDRAHPAHRDERDNARWALKARVVAPRTAAPDDRPHVPLADTVLYELHVKGFTMRHPGVPEALRGTFAGLASDAAIAHFKRLGVTTLNLLPVALHLDEERLVRLNLVNHWGYNPIAFQCPNPALAAGPSAADEFHAMVRRLHAAGLEVVLDVVFNHTAESDETGPTLSLRGLDNAGYYRLPPADRARYENMSGCGNTLDLRCHRTLQLVTDSLRFWAGEMGVDGFRFDLAPVLGRGDHLFDRRAPFFAALAQDPLLARCKLIAEPWDVGHDGYQLGNFPNRWLEWNDRFRDTMRGFWLTRSAQRGAFALRLAGSADLFQPRGRSPCESVNYVASHDGFVAADLVTYAERHNDANGEANRDGHGHNLSINCGVEGPTADPAIRAQRGALMRALLASTLLAQGTPMLRAGDEIGHSQHGNNNAYCQDNALSWLDWPDADATLAAFVARVLALRRERLPFAPRWYDGSADGHGVHDLTWFRSDGHALHGDDWNDARHASLACLIGKPGRGTAPLLLLVNAGGLPSTFRLPPGLWHCRLDTSAEDGARHWAGRGPEAHITLAAHALAVLEAQT